MLCLKKYIVDLSGSEMSMNKTLKLKKDIQPHS